MLLVGLTGGIGAGKSSVARMLESRGAVVFDADDLAAEALQPGTSGYAAAVARFGTDVKTPGGELDRAKLARLIFGDEDARRDLETIVHPEVFRLLDEALRPFRDTDTVVVFSAPLLVESGFHERCDVVVVVSASLRRRIDRLVRDRGMGESEVRGRAGAQAPEARRAEVADVLLPNEGTLEELEARVDELWIRLLRWPASSSRTDFPAG